MRQLFFHGFLLLIHMLASVTPERWTNTRAITFTIMAITTATFQRRLRLIAAIPPAPVAMDPPVQVVMGSDLLTIFCDECVLHWHYYIDLLVGQSNCTDNRKNHRRNFLSYLVHRRLMITNHKELAAQLQSEIIKMEVYCEILEVITTAICSNRKR